MEHLQFNEKIDLLKVEQLFKQTEKYSFNGNTIYFEVDSCIFQVTKDSIRCSFPTSKYYVVANTLLNLIEFHNTSGIHKLLSLVGDSEFVKTGEFTILLEKYQKENETLFYENQKLKKNLKQLEVTITTQEAQLSELRKRILQYESLSDDVVSEMIVASIKENSSFSIVLFAKKNNLTVQQVSKCLSTLISSGVVSKINEEHYSKEFSKEKYKLLSLPEQVFHKINNLLIQLLSQQKKPEKI